MRCEEVDINLAENLRLISEIKLDNKVYPKGYALTKEDIIIFKMHNIRRILGAFMDENDIDYRTALGIVAAKLCGPNTAYAIDNDGICRIIATLDGVLLNNEDRVAKFNRFNDNVIFNTIEPYADVHEGEIIASVEITLPALSEAAIDDILFKLSGNTEMLMVTALSPLKASLVYAKIQDNAAENKHFTAVVKKLVKEFSALQIEFSDEYSTMYEVEAVADSLQDALKTGNDVIFVLSAARNSGRQDVLPRALNKIVDEVVNYHLPQIGASDLLIAEKKQQKIVVLPFDYDKSDPLIINRYIKQALFSGHLTPFDFERHQPASLPSGTPLDAAYRSALVIGHNQHADTKKANIGAVILAAGIGSRTGRNKLMVEVEDDMPLFMKAVNAALGSDASPVFIVTGYHDEEMRDYLENIDINILYNPAYRSGIKTSIALGLKSVPAFCEGAVLLPADMPNITAQDINKLIAAFKRGEEKQICMFTHHGEKANPIIWSQALYAQADIVPENANLRPVFVEHSDYTKYVEVKDDGKFMDVNFPSDVEKVSKKNK